jgi:hypothetical protein
MEAEEIFKALGAVAGIGGLVVAPASLERKE